MDIDVTSRNKNGRRRDVTFPGAASSDTPGSRIMLTYFAVVMSSRTELDDDDVDDVVDDVTSPSALLDVVEMKTMLPSSSAAALDGTVALDTSGFFRKREIKKENSLSSQWVVVVNTFLICLFENEGTEEPCT